MNSGHTLSQYQQGLVDEFFGGSADYWDRLYANTDVISTIYQYRRDVTVRWIRELGVRSPALVADIGCGSGATAVLLAQAGFQVHAIDRVISMLELTARNSLVAGVSDRITTKEGDVHTLNVPSNTYDVVVALGVLPWLHSPHMGLREIARVTRPGGAVVLSADNRWRMAHILDPAYHPWISPVRRAMGNLLRRICGRGFPGSTTLVRMQSLAEVDLMLAQAGLEKLRGMTMGFGPLSLLGREVLPDRLSIRINSLLQRYADRGLWPLAQTGAHYLLLARKQALPN